jgi:chromosome segregation ATPase
MAERHSGLHAEKTSLEAALAEAHAQRQALSTELEVEKARSYSITTQITESAAVFANLRNQIKTAHAEIEQNKKNHQELKTNNKQLVLVRDELFARLSANEEQIQKTQEQLNERATSIHALESKILETNERNAKLATKAEASEARCKTLEEECHDLRANIAERFEELAKIMQIFSRAEAERDTKHEEMEELCAQYANQRGTLAKKITEIQSALSNACAQRDELSSKSQQLENRCSSLQDIINERFQELAKFAQIIVTKDGELENLRNGIAKLKSSLSWELTKFMRWPIFSRYTKPQRILRENIKIINKSGLFDRDYYLDTYPDVAKSKTNAIKHYLNHGALEKRNPSIHFDTNFYLEMYHDVASNIARINPLVHFILHGKKEGRSAKRS